MGTFKDLNVWNSSVEIATDVYKVTKSFPQHEQYGLSSQLRRAVVSIASNIAEGSKRTSNKEFINFLRIAQGSGAELETQIVIARNLEYVSIKDSEALLEKLDYIMRMLTKLINSIKNK